MLSEWFWSVASLKQTDGFHVFVPINDEGTITQNKSVPLRLSTALMGHHGADLLLLCLLNFARKPASQPHVGPQRERLSTRSRRKQQRTPPPFCFHIFHVHQLLQGNPKAFPAFPGSALGALTRCLNPPNWLPSGILVLTMVLKLSKCYFNKRWKYVQTQIINLFGSLTWRLLPQK